MKYKYICIDIWVVTEYDGSDAHRTNAHYMIFIEIQFVFILIIYTN